MKGFSRPSPAEERWLALGRALGSAAPPGAIADRAGGWRATGTLARIALFFLGIIAVALLYGILGFEGSSTLLFAGLIASIAAESLAAGKRLFASGIEEGLCLGGWLTLGAWLSTTIDTQPGMRAETLIEPILIVMSAAAGLRLLNPFVTTVAAIACVHWITTTDVARAVDSVIGGGLLTLLLGCSLAAFALVLGGRTYQRPSHDRMLDWLVATLPIASYWQSASWFAFDPANVSRVGTARVAIILVLAALGSAMLLIGVRRRRHAPLLGFMGCVVGVALEVRFAVGYPTEAWLIGCGLAALVVGVVLDRSLRQRRNGFTSMATATREGPLDLLQTAGAAVLAGSHPGPAPRAEPEVTGSGGRFGGGGASGSF
jgi:hypothetical protein